MVVYHAKETMKKFSSLLNKSVSRAEPVSLSTDARDLETHIAETIVSFCERKDSTLEAVCLAEIVQTAEASAAASRRAGRVIKDVLRKRKYKYLKRENAVMLVEILAKNPGKPFLEGLMDPEVIEGFRQTLQTDPDHNVQSVLRQGLNWIEEHRANDSDVREQLKPLMEMWRQERTRRNVQPWGPAPPQFFGYSHGPGGYHPQQQFQPSLPPPGKLSNLVDRAKSLSAALVSSAQDARKEEKAERKPIVEYDDTIFDIDREVQDLTRQFHVFCNIRAPYPDNETMKTLIESYSILTASWVAYWKIVLESREAFGDPALRQRNQAGGAVAPAQPGGISEGQFQSQDPRRRPVPSPSPDTAADNPFADSAATPPAGPPPSQLNWRRQQNNYSLFGSGPGSGRESSSRPRDSYVARQDSAANNVTMSGASSPPAGEGVGAK